MEIPPPLPDFVVTPLGLAFTVLALGVGYEDYARGRRPWSTAVALSAAAAVDGYAGMLAAVTLTYFLHDARRPVRTLAWLGLAVAAAAGLAAFALQPWAVEWARVPGAALPLTDAPIFAWPLLVPAVLGALWATTLASKPRGGLDRRAGLVGYAVAVAAILPAVLPTLPPRQRPLELAGRGPGLGIGVAATVATVLTVALVVLKERRAALAPVPKAMPRALTPALLEMSPPPDAPLRWGGLVGPSLLSVLFLWRFLRSSFL
jgi:hypothetical protein